MAGKKTNPNGANQFVADPRQALFLSHYLDPKSATFSNALQSALKAGFAQEYAENIMSLMPTWLSERLGNSKTSRMLEKAERNLEEILDLPSQVQAMGAFGPIFEKTSKKVKGRNGKMVQKMVNGKPVMVYAGTLLKIKNDASQFVAERVGKKVYGPDSPDGNKTLIVVISGQSSQRYGANPTPSNNSVRSA